MELQCFGELNGKLIILNGAQDNQFLQNALSMPSLK